MVSSWALRLLTFFTQESGEEGAFSYFSVTVFLLVLFSTLYARGVESCQEVEQHLHPPPGVTRTETWQKKSTENKIWKT